MPWLAPVIAGMTGAGVAAGGAAAAGGGGLLGALGGGAGIGSLLQGAGSAAGAFGNPGGQQYLQAMTPKQLVGVKKLLDQSALNTAVAGQGAIGQNKKALAALQAGFKGAQANAALAGSTAKQGVLDQQTQALAAQKQQAVNSGMSGFSTSVSGIGGSNQIYGATGQSLAAIDAALAEHTSQLSIAQGQGEAALHQDIGSTMMQANAQQTEITQMITQAIANTLSKKGYDAFGKKKKTTAKPKLDPSKKVLYYVGGKPVYEGDTGPSAGLGGGGL